MPSPWLFLAALMVALPAMGQVRTSPGDSAVSEHTGSIGEDSQPIGEGSRPMKGDPTIGESSGGTFSDGRLRYGPVRESSRRGMLSGPVSSISRGPMTQPRTLRDGGSVTEASAGAVKHDIDRPLGSRISQPLRELGPLQEQLRAVRQHGDAAALAAAAAPVAPAVELPKAHGDLPATEPAFEGHMVGEPLADAEPLAEHDAAAPDEVAPAAHAEADDEPLDSNHGEPQP